MKRLIGEVYGRESYVGTGRCDVLVGDMTGLAVESMFDQGAKADVVPVEEVEQTQTGSAMDNPEQVSGCIIVPTVQPERGSNYEPV